MKSINYQHSWDSDLTDEQEQKKLFGELLYEYDASESYEVESAHLYQAKDGTYNLLEANGCSCWDGDYDGWNYTKLQLIKWAKAKTKKQEYDWRKQAFEYVADWVMENLVEPQLQTQVDLKEQTVSGLKDGGDL